MLWLLGALTIVGLIGVGLAAMRDPEAGLVTPAAGLESLIVPRPSYLDPLQGEIFRLIERPLAEAGLMVFPRGLMQTVFRPGRLIGTGWHRIRNADVDFVIVRRDTFATAGLIVLDTGLEGHYLEEENRQMKEDAVAESGVPFLKLQLSSDASMGEAVDEVMAWIRALVARAQDPARP